MNPAGEALSASVGAGIEAAGNTLTQTAANTAEAAVEGGVHATAQVAENASLSGITATAEANLVNTAEQTLSTKGPDAALETLAHPLVENKIDTPQTNTQGAESLNNTGAADRPTGDATQTENPSINNDSNIESEAVQKVSDVLSGDELSQDMLNDPEFQKTLDGLYKKATEKGETPDIEALAKEAKAKYEGKSGEPEAQTPKSENSEQLPKIEQHVQQLENKINELSAENLKLSTEMNQLTKSVGEMVPMIQALLEKTQAEEKDETEKQKISGWMILLTLLSLTVFKTSEGVGKLANPK